MEFETFTNHQIDEKWYRPTELYDLTTSKNEVVRKCRVIGYLCVTDGKYYLQNLHSAYGAMKCRVRILVNDLRTIPPFSPPQPVQIFGEVCYLSQKSLNCSRINSEINSEDVKTKVSNSGNACSEILGIKAKVIQYVPPSLVDALNKMVMKKPENRQYAEQKA